MYLLFFLLGIVRIMRKHKNKYLLPTYFFCFLIFLLNKKYDIIKKRGLKVKTTRKHFIKITRMTAFISSKAKTYGFIK